MTAIPTCPTCRFDLSATPDGRCPECGSEFTHAEVERLRLGRLARPGPVAWTLRIVSAGVAVAAVLELLELSARDPFLLNPNAHKVLLVLSGLWLLAFAESLRSARGQRATVLALLVASLTTLALGSLVLSTPFAAVVFAGFPLLFGAAARLRSGSRRAWWLGLLACGLALCIIGGVWVGDSTSRLRGGVALSAFEWQAEPYYTGRYTIETRRALVIGAALLAAGSLSAVIALLRLGRRARRITP